MTLYRIRTTTIEQEFDENGRHRLIVNGVAGDWAGYAFLAFWPRATKHRKKVQYVGTTENYAPDLPRVFAIEEGESE